MSDKLAKPILPSKIAHLVPLSLDLEIPSLMLWVKEETFLFGLVSPNPCVKLSLPMIRKLSDYCKGKTDYFPLMSLSSWGHISKYKLQISIELAWTYFRVFDILLKHVDSAANLKNKDAYDIEMEKVRRAVAKTQDVKMDTLQFILFLYMQSFFRLQNKFQARSPSFDETWPISSSDEGRCSSGTPDSTKSKTLKSAVKRKPIPEQTHLQFVVTNLADIIECLLLATKKKKHKLSKSGKEDTFVEMDNRIPLNVVHCLSLIIGAASINGKLKDTEFSTLDQCIAALPDAAKAVDYKQEHKTVDKQLFISWVKMNLKLNPWGPSSTPVPQKTVDCLSGIWQQTQAYESNRIYWNTQLYPKGWYLISTVNSQVIYLDSVQPLSSLKIHRCSDSYIYAPGAFVSIIVEKCHNSTIFLGATAKFVKFVECTNLQVSAVGRVFVIQDVVKSTFSILTPTAPVVCGGKGRKIVFGPYNTFYPQLELHMNLVGLGVVVQKWDKAIELDAQGALITKSQTQNGSYTSSYSLIRSEKFSKLIFPFQMDGTTSRNPCELPRNYAKRLTELESNLLAFEMQVKSKNLTDDKKDLLRTIIQARFHNWLKQQGHLNQLKGLKSIQKSISLQSSVPVLETRKSIREEIEKKRKLSRSNTEQNCAKGNEQTNQNKRDISSSRRGHGQKKSDFVIGDYLNENGVKSSSLRSNSRHRSPQSSEDESDMKPGKMSKVFAKYGSQQEGELEAGDEDVFIQNGEMESIYFLDSEEDDDDYLTDAFVDEGEKSISARNEDGDCSTKQKSTRFQNLVMDDGLLWSPI